LQKAAQQIVEKHQGKFPEDFDAILDLPGVGRYTAGAICSIAFSQATPILDGNVIRVLTRIFGIGTDPREKRTNAQLWQLAGEMVACASSARHKSPCSNFNQSLMELGALVCAPRQPGCIECPVKKICVAFRENRVGQLPHLGKRAAVTERRFSAFICERNGKFLVRQRPAGGINARLWEFPNLEYPDGTRDFYAAVPTMPGTEPRALKPFCVVKHSITRYRITLEAFMLEPEQFNHLMTRGDRWLSLPELTKLSFPSAHKKILAALADRR
jgi:A/G-specific adenine glycosylase